MTQMIDEKKIIDAHLKKIAFISVKTLNGEDWQRLIDEYIQEHNRDKRIPSGGSLKEYNSGALVETEEIWEYQYLDYKTRKKVHNLMSLGYDVSYILVVENKKWKVADIIFVEKEMN